MARKPRKIPREWYSLLPRQSLAFWVKVDMLRRERGITKKDRVGVRKCADDLFFGKEDI